MRQILLLIVSCMSFCLVAHHHSSLKEVTHKRVPLTPPVCAALLTVTIYSLINPHTTTDNTMILGISSLVLTGYLMHCFA